MKEALDAQEIKGITLKILWYIIYGTATVCAFVVGTYFMIRIQITQIQDKAIQQDQRMDNLQVDLNRMSLRMDEEEKKANDLQVQILVNKK